MKPSQGGDPDSQRGNHWSRGARLAFLAAALPAGFLPLSYGTGALFVVLVMMPSMLTGGTGPRPDDFPVVKWILEAGIYLTFIQWPIYLAWAACSRELSLRVRLLWMATIFLLNMFAMPWFLFCMYLGTADRVPGQIIGHRGLREWFERKG